MIDIRPNFGVKDFETEDEAKKYLQKLGFKVINRRSDYSVFETEEEPKKRATMHRKKNGRYFVGQLVEKK